MESISFSNFERALLKEHPCEVSSGKEEMSFEAIVDDTQRRTKDAGHRLIPIAHLEHKELKTYILTIFNHNIIHTSQIHKSQIQLLFKS